MKRYGADELRQALTAAPVPAAPSVASVAVSNVHVPDDRVLRRRVALALTEPETFNDGQLGVGRAFVDVSDDVLEKWAPRVAAMGNALRPDGRQLDPAETLRKLRDGRAFAQERGLRPPDAGPDPSQRGAVEFDFDLELPPPDYLAEPIEQGDTFLIRGDTGSAKSIVGAALSVAAIKGEKWLGKPVKRSKVLVLDEENPERLVRARLRALGLTNDHRENLRYFSRIGALLGSADWLDWLEGQIAELGAGLVLIDSTSAATAAEINDNDSAADLMRQVRSVAARTGAAIGQFHHERKRQTGQPRDGAHAAMGARQWVAQADAELSLAVAGDFMEYPDDHGRTRTERLFTMRAPKVRSGGLDVARTVAVTSTRGPAGQLLRMAVEERGETSFQPRQEVAIARQVVALVRELGGDVPSGKLATLVGRKRDDGTFKRALKHAQQQQWLVGGGKNGTYQLGEQALEGASDGGD